MFDAAREGPRGRSTRAEPWKLLPTPPFTGQFSHAAIDTVGQARVPRIGVHRQRCSTKIFAQGFALPVGADWSGPRGSVVLDGVVWVKRLGSSPCDVAVLFIGLKRPPAARLLAFDLKLANMGSP